MEKKCVKSCDFHFSSHLNVQKAIKRAPYLRYHLISHAPFSQGFSHLAITFIKHQFEQFPLIKQVIYKPTNTQLKSKNHLFNLVTCDRSYNFNYFFLSNFQLITGFQFETNFCILSFFSYKNPQFLTIICNASECNNKIEHFEQKNVQ